MKTLFFALTLIIISSCSSSKLVNEWKNPDTEYFQSNKVLVIGLAEDRDLRREFERELTLKLQKNNVIAVKSIDFFEASFLDQKKTEEEINAIETQLLEAGFDAILLSKVIGSENKITLVQAIQKFDESFDSFRADYYQSQDAFYSKNEYQPYTLYHAQTNLYCICPDKQRELLWSGNIDIVDSDNRAKSIRNYVKTLLEILENQQLLLVH